MNISPVPTPTIEELLPMQMMFLYGCVRQGQINIDRENKTINVTEMPYDIDMLRICMQQLERIETEYKTNLENLGISLSSNDETLFNSIHHIYNEIKTFI